MLADLPASVRRDARILVEYAAVLEGSIVEHNERQAIDALKTVLFRARLLEKWLPKEEEGESNGSDN